MVKSAGDNLNLTFIRGGHGLTGVKNTYGEYWCSINKSSEENKFYLPVSGRGELFLNGKHYAMEKYKWFLIGTEDIRSYYTTEDNHFEHYVMHFYGEASGKDIKKALKLPDFVPLEADEYEKALALMNRFSMYDVSAPADIYQLFSNKSKVYDALSYYIELAEKKNLFCGGNDDADAEIRTLLFKSIVSVAKKEKSIKEVSAAVGMNEKYFLSYFKKLFYITPHKLVHKIKRMNMKSRLTDSPYNVSEIAQMSGFENSKYFYEYFKKYIGMTPLQFRRSGEGIALHDSSEAHKNNKND